jgi:hypothetical protein
VVRQQAQLAVTRVFERERPLRLTTRLQQKDPGTAQVAEELIPLRAGEIAAEEDCGQLGPDVCHPLLARHLSEVRKEAPQPIRRAGQAGHRLGHAPFRPDSELVFQGTWGPVVRGRRNGQERSHERRQRTDGQRLTTTSVCRLRHGGQARVVSQEKEAAGEEARLGPGIDDERQGGAHNGLMNRLQSRRDRNIGELSIAGVQGGSQVRDRSGPGGAGQVRVDRLPVGTPELARGAERNEATKVFQGSDAAEVVLAAKPSAPRVVDEAEQNASLGAGDRLVIEFREVAAGPVVKQALRQAPGEPRLG